MVRAATTTSLNTQNPLPRSANAWCVPPARLTDTPLANAARGKPDAANLREEFADVLAWVTTLANISGVDLEQAVREKYMGNDGGPKGEK